MQKRSRTAGRPCPQEDDFNRDRHTAWLRDELKRTPRCDICNMKCAYPNQYSLVCNYIKCRRRICQKCYEGDRHDDRTADRRAVDMVENGDWCQYTSAPGAARNGMNPLFRDDVYLPTKQFAEDLKNLKIQQNAKRSNALGAAGSGNGGKQTDSAGAPGADGNATQDMEVNVGEDLNADTSPYRSRGLRIQPTMTSERPHRAVKAKAPLVDESSDEGMADSVENDGTTSTARMDTNDATGIDRLLGNANTHLKATETTSQKTIVVIGGGVVGLCVALELAKRAKECPHEDEIIVVEREPDVFARASGRCAGLITSHGMAQDVREAGGLQVAAAWDALRSQPGFEMVGWNENALFRHYQASETNEYWKLSHISNTRVRSAPFPNWLQHPKTGCMEVFATDKGASLAMLDPRKLGKWLRNACEQQGVNFLFGREVTQYADGGLITFENKTAKVEHVACNNVVIAAGPWSKSLIDKMYPANLLQLRGRQYAAEWMLLQEQAVQEGSAGDQIVTALKGATSMPDLDNRLTYVAHGKKQDILLTAEQSEDLEHEYPKVHGENRLATRNFRTQLVQLASSNVTGGTAIDPDMYTEGREFLCTAHEDSPALAVLNPFDLSENGHAAKDHYVWLAYGLGYHGTTLAPLVGKIVAGLVYGEDYYGHPLVLQPEVRKPKGVLEEGDVVDDSANRVA